jgi:hypothetical protein
VLPLNRIVIVGFALFVLAAGLAADEQDAAGHVRPRRHAEPRHGRLRRRADRRIDTVAFALGAGIAGLGGVALSQIANVGPDMGQGYIVDSFMVVVLGGVGQLAGAVWAALGLGIVTKFLEGWAGAVIAKIVVLVFIIIFIQKRPQGCSPSRAASSRTHECAPPSSSASSAPAQAGLDRHGGLAAITLVLVPALHLLVPEGSSFHVSAYAITLIGKIMCYAMVAVAMDLIWGYGGILRWATACSSPSAATPSACT